MSLFAEFYSYVDVRFVFVLLKAIYGTPELTRGTSLLFPVFCTDKLYLEKGLVDTFRVYL